MHVFQPFLFAAIFIASCCQADKFAKYFESVMLYYAYKYDSMAFGSSRVLVPTITPTEDREVATFGEFMSEIYQPNKGWKFPTPSDLGKDEKPGLESSLDPMEDPNNLKTMLHEWQMSDRYRKNLLFPKDVANNIKNHVDVLKVAVDRIDAVRDLDIKATGNTPKILQGRMATILLLFKYTEWSRQAAIMRHNGLQSAFSETFENDKLVVKNHEVSETGLTFEVADWDATALENTGGDHEAAAAKAQQYRDWHAALDPKQGSTAEKKYISHFNSVSALEKLGNTLGSLSGCRAFDDPHL